MAVYINLGNKDTSSVIHQPKNLEDPHSKQPEAKLAIV